MLACNIFVCIFMWKAGMMILFTAGATLLNIPVHSHLATIICCLAMEASWDAGKSCSVFTSGKDRKYFGEERCHNPGECMINTIICPFLKMCSYTCYYHSAVQSVPTELKCDAPGRYKTKKKLFNQKFILTIAGCQDGNHYSWMHHCK